jgi:DNA primase
MNSTRGGSEPGLAGPAAAVVERIAAARRRAETARAIHSPAVVERDPELVQIHAEAGRFYQACLHGSWVPGYLASRGLDAALLPSSPWKIGYAPETWTTLTEHLRRLGHCDAALLCSGLVVNGKNGQLRDHFHDRLMIPIRAEDGYLVGFIGRRHPAAGDDHGPKYLNSPDTELFSKGRVLAGLAEGRSFLAKGAQPVLVEGPLDAIAVSVAGHGDFAGVAPCGTALTGEQVAALARTVDLRESGIRIALDADQAGRKAAVRVYQHLAPLADPLAVTLPDGADPASVLLDSGRDALREVLHRSVRPLADLAVDAALDDWAHGRVLVFAELQLGALRAAARVIAAMPDHHVGPQAARLCGIYRERYGWDHGEVTAEIIAGIERHYGTGIQISPTPWAVVMRATAPPHQRAASSAAAGDPRRPHLRLVPSSQAGRGLAKILSQVLPHRRVSCR